MKKMMFLSHNWYFSVQKALIYYTFNKSHHNSFILLVFSHVANFRYVANFRFLTLLSFPSVISYVLTSEMVVVNGWVLLCLLLLAEFIKYNKLHFFSFGFISLKKESRFR